MASYLVIAHEYNLAAAVAAVDVAPSAPEPSPAAPAAAPKMPAPPPARKRARTPAGAFMADDPSTPENEAWEDKQP